MRQPHSPVSELARRLLLQEAGGRLDVDNLVDGFTRTFDKLRAQMTRLMGADGFTLLLVRALTFARADSPWLAGLKAELDGTLTGLPATVGALPPADVAAGFVAILSHFLGLLVTFIGERMTLRLVQGVWPDVDLGDRDPGMEEPL